MKYFLRRRLGANIVVTMTIAALVLGGSAVAVTPSPEGHDIHHADSTPETTNACSALTAATPAAGSMMTDDAMTDMPVDREFDPMFIDMMIVHHEGAVAMAKIALDRGEHQEVLELAQDIISSQSAEMDQLRAWRDSWYPGEPAMPIDQMGQMMGQMMGEMIASMPGMKGTPVAGMGDIGSMMGMMNLQAEASAVCAADEPFDKAFLEAMIPHHQSAIAMAQVTLAQPTHPEMTLLANHVVEAQQQEIADMQAWRAAWYKDSAGLAPGRLDIATEVKVTLTEFEVTSSTVEFMAGETYRFIVTNEGTVAHEFMIIPHVEGMGQLDMETLDDMALVMIHAGDLPAGTTQSVEITFDQDAVSKSLELVCAAPGHYDAGMKLPISVIS